MKKIPCPNCAGKGVVDLPDWGQQLLGIMRTFTGYSASELLDRIPAKISVNAVNNRLEKLRALGFVEREREGKFWIYSKTK